MAEPHHHGQSLDLTEHDHVQGEVSAPVVLIEYGDFQCPFSREAVKTVRALQREFDRSLRFVFRHFPLVDKHSHALQAAEAAEAAAAQGQFWAMYTMLFANQWELEYGDLMEYAKQLELDRTQFSESLTTHRHLDRIRTDVGTGRRHGVTGTPTFFINGRRQDGNDDLRALAAAMRHALGS
ncbi:DSBA oxidoreductase [Nitrospira japonica]|uniref:DSBA oxidoreductase n=1 Tax=Nitrospira japonica TaxID=1325564 RepID=A0A1W1I8R5_9BACT|nr:thioredoxin domain-containing protein [Nitrospira japonica]SLM49407.1 DSBA oxidoreductase [Nitrospira japonica]